MRYAIASTILVNFLATRFPGSNAGVIPVELQCRSDQCPKLDGIGWSVVNDLHRRAGGGGGGKGNKGENGGEGGTPGGGGNGGGGNGSPQTEGGQTGETGGFGAEETEGGFSTCTKKRGWPLFWRRSPAGCEGDSSDPNTNPPTNPNNNPPANNPSNNNGGQQYPPSVRNNHNTPATTTQRTYDPAANNLEQINVAQVAQDMRELMKEKGLEGGPWYFYSGVENRQQLAVELRPELSIKLNMGWDENTKLKLIPSMEDVKRPVKEDAYASAYMGGANEPYFWAAYSKAYSQAISGKVVVVIPEGRAINQPYGGVKGSNWWSFEAPELTRNPNIEEIQLVRKLKQEFDPLNLDDAEYQPSFGDPKTIWRREQEPLGFPGDEHYGVTEPAAPLDL